jgi:Bacterial tandem repeat domain 1
VRATFAAGCPSQIELDPTTPSRRLRLVLAIGDKRLYEMCVQACLRDLQFGSFRPSLEKIRTGTPRHSKRSLSQKATAGHGPQLVDRVRWFAQEVESLLNRELRRGGGDPVSLTAENVVAWHDRTPEQHEALFKRWSAKGFRPVSLSLYGATLLPLFAAVMVKRKVVIEAKQFGPLDQAATQKAIDKPENQLERRAQAIHLAQERRRDPRQHRHLLPAD